MLESHLTLTEGIHPGTTTSEHATHGGKGTYTTKTTGPTSEGRGEGR